MILNIFISVHLLVIVTWNMEHTKFFLRFIAAFQSLAFSLYFEPVEARLQRRSVYCPLLNMPQP